MTIIHVTDSKYLLEETLCEMMGVSEAKALTIETLIKAMARLPVKTMLHFDKIYGRWIFTNQDEDEWPKAVIQEKDGTKIVRKAHNISGPNFTFVDEVPETALARGIYYYYHTKIKE